MVCFFVTIDVLLSMLSMAHLIYRRTLAPYSLMNIANLTKSMLIESFFFLRIPPTINFLWKILQSSFLGRGSKSSLPSSRKHGSSMVRSFVFERDDSSSRSAISMPEDSSNLVSFRSLQSFK